MSWENTAKIRELSRGRGGLQPIVDLTDGLKPCTQELVEFMLGP